MVSIENFLKKPKENLLLGSVKDVIKISQKFGQKKHSSKIKQMVLCGLNSAIQVQQIGHKRSVVYIENFLMKPKENPLLGSVKAVIKISQRFGQKKIQYQDQTNSAMWLKFYSADFQVQQIRRKRSMVYIQNFLKKPKGNLLLGSVKDVIKISQKFG